MLENASHDPGSSIVAMAAAARAGKDVNGKSVRVSCAQV